MQYRHLYNVDFKFLPRALRYVQCPCHDTCNNECRNEWRRQYPVTSARHVGNRKDRLRMCRRRVS